MRSVDERKPASFLLNCVVLVWTWWIITGGRQWQDIDNVKTQVREHVSTRAYRPEWIRTKWIIARHLALRLHAVNVRPVNKGHWQKFLSWNVWETQSKLVLGKFKVTWLTYCRDEYVKIMQNYTCYITPKPQLRQVKSMQGISKNILI
jgi:hypothetical protein